MADNVAVNTGSGATVATDDVSGVHYQKVKIYTGESDKGHPLQVDPATGVPVNVRSITLIAEQTNITGGAGAVASNTPRVTHASNDPVVTAVEIMDDWDETNRAAVNLIAGQVAITAGAGAVAANTPRVTHASDDPVTVALQIMDDWDESNRAAVNTISGQVGVAGGTGVDGATVQRVTLATNVSLPSGTTHIGKATVYHATDLMKDGAVDVQPKYAVITAHSAESNTIVAAVSGKKIRVVSGYLMASGTVVAQFKTGSNGAAIGGGLPLTAQTGAVLPFCPVGWFETQSNTLLSLHLNAAVFVDGGITYIEV